MVELNPYKIDEIKNAVLKLSKNKELYLNLQNKGIKRAAFFTWKNAAKVYIEAFKSVYNGQNL